MSEESKKRMKYEVKFSDVWLSNPMFKDFLTKKKVGDKFVPYCAAHAWWT